MGCSVNDDRATGAKGSLQLWAGGATSRAGHWLARNGTGIRRLQWLVVAVYLGLIVLPVVAAQHPRLAWWAQFLLWGLWWPLVLLSVALLGRAWCGLLCPEGTLTQWASRHGQGRYVPRWLWWGGWPFVAFSATTLAGQWLGIYHDARATLLILGSSSAAALVLGYCYGRDVRVWCRSLCPVNGVFALLAKLAPLHFRVDVPAWRASYGQPVAPLHCPPLVALRKMEGASDCHLCGACSGHRQAVALTPRSPQVEIAQLGAHLGGGWQTLLLLLGLLGMALTSFVPVPLAPLPFARQALGLGLGLALLLAAATRLLGPWRRQRFYHLSQALIPLAGAAAVVGLSASTQRLLAQLGWAAPGLALLRGGLLALASLWSLVLFQAAARHYPARPWQRALALLPLALAVAWVQALLLGSGP